ncbi:MAG: hypothetical protein CME64_02215 [Halobacteriovoraceae bacterium]|nr:hypothetical protein [Halobacteriovoraceae bacterium]|tara:strand:+ start:21907 stop:22875 length:969 start_codon:yes stop_codon:yes gene_type:complete
MKNALILFVLLFIQSAWSLEPYQGQDHDVEDWRCGAPVVETLRSYDPLDKLDSSGVNAKLKESLESISTANLNYYKSILGTLSSEEQALIDHIEQNHPVPIVHRTSLDVAKLMLVDRKSLSSPVKRGAPPRVTPGIEQGLFSGWDCIYASAGPPYGIQNYGTVLVRLKNESNFSWGSIYTGFSWTKEVVGRSIYDPATESMKRDFAKQIYTNNHYNEAIALHIIHHVRNGTSIRSKGRPYNKATILKELLKITNSDRFWSKVAYHRLGFLEAHYTDDVSLNDIEFVQFRTKDMPVVKLWGLPSKWYGAGAYSGFIQHYDRED